MGREAVCQCTWAGASAGVKALLETSELVLRGEIRRKIPLADLKQVAVRSGRLRFTVGGEPVELHLGPAQAEKWAAALKAGPVPLARKLGVTGETVVRTLGRVTDPALASALQSAARISARNPQLIVACVATPKELAAALAKSEAQAAKGAPVWLIYPKGPGHALNESMVRAAGLAAGLVDTKVASISAALTALRFNRRRAEP
jgi:hypothetical protein